MRTRLISVAVVVGSLGSVFVTTAAPTEASGTAQVRLVDNYTHGRIRIYVNGVSHRMHEGDRIGPFAVTPDPMGNDSITVKSLRFDGCGGTQIGKFFRAGHSYRILINDYRGGRCHLADGRTVRAPGAHLDPSTY